MDLSAVKVYSLTVFAKKKSIIDLSEVLKYVSEERHPFRVSGSYYEIIPKINSSMLCSRKTYAFLDKLCLQKPAWIELYRSQCELHVES